MYRIFQTPGNIGPKCKKVKAFPYSIPSVGPGADPGVQAVSPQVTVSHPPGGRMPLLSARPAVTSPAADHNRPLAVTKLYCLVTEARVNNFPRLLRSVASSRIWIRDLPIASPTLYPLHYRATPIYRTYRRQNCRCNYDPFPIQVGYVWQYDYRFICVREELTERCFAHLHWSFLCM